MISSRPQGYRTARVEGAVVVEVCGFTVRQVADFVHAWYQAEQEHSTGTTGPEVDALAARGATDLLLRLGQTPALYALAVNPLLLTMIVNVHKHRGALPGSRADLYSEICQVMLWRRQEAKQLRIQVSGDKQEAILRSLAYAMMERRVSDLSRADVLAEVQPFLRRVSRGVTPAGFLADTSSNGLLIERESGQYAFAHKTIQEYLASAYIRDQGLVSVLASAVGDDWWAETTLLYTAKASADPVIRSCLTDGTAPALALALDCDDQDSDVDPDLRDRLHATVASAASPDAAPGHRRLFAAILLRRHIRQRIPTSGDSQICTRPVPADIYRLFLADTMTPEPDAPQGQPGTAFGMRGADADAFVRWANDVGGAEHAYRLPLATELAEVTAQRPVPALPSGEAPAVWSQPGPAGAKLWLAPGAHDPYATGHALLTDAIAADAERMAPALSGLLLLRARILIYSLNRALDQVRNLDPEHVRDLGLARATAIDLDLALDHARDSELGQALDDDVLDLARDLAQARGRTDEHARAPARELSRARQTAQASERELTAARAKVRQLIKARNGARAEARSYQRQLASARTQARHRERQLTQGLVKPADQGQAGKVPFQLTQALAQARAQASAVESAYSAGEQRARAQARDYQDQLSQASTRERELARAQDRLLAEVRTLTLALDFAQASGRDEVFALALDFDRACALASTRALSDALDLDRALTLDLPSDPTGDLTSPREGHLAEELASAHSHDGESILALTRAVNEAAGRHVLWRSFSEPILSSFDGAFGELLGRVFALSFTDDAAVKYKAAGRGNTGWTSVLTELFTLAAAVQPASHVAADPGTLESTLEDALRSLMRILEQQDSAGAPRSSSWPAIVAEQLRHGAAGIIARTERPTTGKATTSRLTALCLASEADAMGHPDIGDMFRQVAAGVTLLERRATGQCPPAEVIMLAIGPRPFATPGPAKR